METSSGTNFLNEIQKQTKLCFSITLKSIRSIEMPAQETKMAFLGFQIKKKKKTDKDTTSTTMRIEHIIAFST